MYKSSSRIIRKNQNVNKISLKLRRSKMAAEFKYENNKERYNSISRKYTYPKDSSEKEVNACKSRTNKGKKCYCKECG